MNRSRFATTLVVAIVLPVPALAAEGERSTPSSVLPPVVITGEAENYRVTQLDSLGPLLDAKNRNRGQLLETLQAYLAAGSVKDAATALNLHRHTVLYRLDKLRDLLGGDLDTPATRLRLQLALDLRKLL